MSLAEAKESGRKPTTIFDRFPELKKIPTDRFPKNVFIIPDGNGRWAQLHHLMVQAGHKKGNEVAIKAFKDLSELSEQIPFVGAWGFSMDNLARPKGEVDFLMSLFDRTLKTLTPQFKERNNRFVHIGNKDVLAPYQELAETLVKAEEETRFNTGQVVYIAIGFSGSDQNLRVAQKVVKMAKNDPNLEVTDRLLDSLRDGYGVPPADLIIRSSGERRLSDVGWIAGKGTELYFNDKLFPSFTTEDFVKAIVDYSKRDRRLGGRPSLKFKD